jgi:hypothetical protein
MKNKTNYLTAAFENMAKVKYLGITNQTACMKKSKSD